MDMIVAFTIIVAILAIGELISTATKAIIPSVFIQAMLFMVGFWTILPKDVVDISGFGNLSVLAMYLLITHMGTMINLKELAAQWKTVIIAIVGLVGIVIGTMTLGQMIFGWETAVIATPPLTGGTVATLLMGEAAREKGLTHLIVLPILVYVGQGFVGYPLTTVMLKKEGRRLLSGYRSGELKKSVKTEAEVNAKGRLQIFPNMPERFDSDIITLLRLGFVAMLAYFTADAINKVLATSIGITISKFVICLIFGVLGSELGLCDKKALNKAHSFGFLMTALLGYIFAGLKDSTPEMVMSLLVPLMGILFFGILGMYILSFITGKLLKESPSMAFSIALNALYGFPQNFTLTHESAKSLTDDPDEREFLIDAMLPKMLVGGFITVTIASVVIAGIFTGFL